MGAPNIIYVKTPVQLVQVIEQERGALGFAQLALAKQRGIPELVTDRPIQTDAQPGDARQSDAGHAGRDRRDSVGRQENDVAAMIDALHSLKKNTVGRLGQSIAGKLYCFALLSIIAVVALAACSVYFAKTTETAAHRLYDHGFRGTLSAARLSLLLEQHRRLVESMLSEVDRERIDHGRHDLASTRIRSWPS